MSGSYRFHRRRCRHLVFPSPLQIFPPVNLELESDRAGLSLPISTPAPPPRFQRGVGLHIAGPVSYGGRSLTGHIETSRRLARWLQTEMGFTSATVVTPTQNPKAPLAQFFSELKQPGILGVLSYVGHGSPGSWDFGHITNQYLTQAEDMIHESSCLVLISDSCFSDSMGLVPATPHKRNLIFLSAARAAGPDATRSAVYTSEGGFMSTSLMDLLAHKSKVDLRSWTYTAMMKELDSNQKYYAELNPDPSRQLHLPRLKCFPEALSKLPPFVVG